MKRLIVLLTAMLFSIGLQAAIYTQITTQILDNDANGIAEDQTLAAAGNLLINGALAAGGGVNLNSAQIVALESSGNLSAITFTITGRDADGTSVTEAVTGPNNTTVKSTYYFSSINQIAASAAVGTNIEVGVYAADGMITPSTSLAFANPNFQATIAVQLSAGTGTFGIQYTVDEPEGVYSSSFQNSGSWRDAVALDPDINTATGEDNIIVPVRSVRGVVTVGSTTGVYVFTFIQGDK